MQKSAIGIDLGGTAIKGAIIGERGIEGVVTRVPTEAHKGGQQVLDNILGLISELIEDSGRPSSSFIGVGIGTPGFVGSDGTILGGAENLPGWKGTQLYGPITKRFGLGVSAANDVTAVALAELMFGAGRGVKNLVCFALGTGVGGGIVTDGKLYKGTHGMAGEVGHIVVETGGIPCTCGQKGCVERYASATGIVNMAVEMAAGAGDGELTEFVSLVRKNPVEVTSKMIYEYVAKADPVALKVHNRACDMLGRAVGVMINALSPDRVVLGGGVMMAGDVILETVKSYAARHCWPAIFERCEIVPAQMGEDAGVMGAGALAHEQFG
ncbi:MAG: ROK family protein [Chitinispirillia bacterium]|nr:ROK family protein [Chitinispirillia bacterium]MCL2241195.1 ROK family protein [Chitinispirillia bacterium]